VLLFVQVLIVDDNLISSINPSIFSALSRLQVFHCARNAISELPMTVKYLRYLRDINLSENRLTVVPAELIALPRIEVSFVSFLYKHVFHYELFTIFLAQRKTNIWKIIFVRNDEKDLQIAYDRKDVARFFNFGVLNPAIKWSTAINVVVLSFLNDFAIARSFLFGPLRGPRTPSG
jgi:Leucine-rich repeat (LRR) protein